jgi:hypothetical protein
MRVSTLSAAAALATFAAGALNAQPSAPPVKKSDPNEIVCEKQKVPGTRLATAKVCKTRAEWAELKAQDRQDLERAQTQRGMTPQ